MNKYTENSMLLKMLRNSRTRKIKNGWSREAGAGFIESDIKEVKLYGKTFTIYFNFLHHQAFTTADLNLRETEELIKWIEPRRQKELKP